VRGTATPPCQLEYVRGIASWDEHAGGCSMCASVRCTAVSRPSLGAARLAPSRAIQVSVCTFDVDVRGQ